jgi:hypothetical protein
LTIGGLYGNRNDEKEWLLATCFLGDLPDDWQRWPAQEFYKLRSIIMRFVLAVAALGFALGAPALAPTSVMSEAEAQSASLDQSEATLTAQLLAAAGDPAALAAIMAREQSLGRGSLLARALARAAQSLATSGDSSQAATLMTQAISLASGADEATQNSVGAAAGQVVAQITETDPASAARIASSAANSGTTTLQIAYSSGQQSGGFNLETGGTTLTTGDDTTTTTGDDTTTPVVTTPVVTTPTTTVLRPVIPPTSTTPTVPIVPEPNPSQSGDSPT